MREREFIEHWLELIFPKNKTSSWSLSFEVVFPIKYDERGGTKGFFLWFN